MTVDVLFESQAALPKSYKKLRPGCLYFQLLLSLLFFIAAYSLTAVFFCSIPLFDYFRIAAMELNDLFSGILSFYGQ